MGSLGETQKQSKNSSQIYEDIKNRNTRYRDLVNRKKSIREKIAKNNRKLYTLRQIIKLGPEEFNFRQRMIRYKHNQKRRHTDKILNEVRELNAKLKILTEILEARKK